MSAKQRDSKIAKLLNSSFHVMSFNDKKKVLGLVITEQQCDELLIHFLARFYNVNIEEENRKLKEIRNNDGSDVEASCTVSSDGNSDSENEAEEAEEVEELEEVTKPTPLPSKTQKVASPTKVESPPTKDYNSYTITQLKEIATSRGLKFTAKILKSNLIHLLKTNEHKKIVDNEVNEVEVEEAEENEEVEEIEEVEENDEVEVEDENEEDENEDEADEEDENEDEEDAKNSLESLSSLDDE
jgi:hypothetical protein